MKLVVVGSIALDSVRTPFGQRANALGGSATYFSYSASFFTKVGLVGVVGKDFPQEHLALLRKRKIDLAGLQTVEGETFRWSGMYEYDLNEAKTLETHLNVFERFKPELPESYKDTPAVFLANIDPDLQLEVLSQVRQPKLVACDTMNLWISTKKSSLLNLLKRVNLFVLNEGEARQLTGQSSLIKAGQEIRSWGPAYVVIKKGEHGALLFTPRSILSAPAFPLEEVYDPTGAGDTFAGGLMGFLSQKGAKLNDTLIHQGLFYGTVMASFNVEKFSLERLKTVKPAEIRGRLKKLRNMVTLQKFPSSNNFRQGSMKKR